MGDLVQFVDSIASSPTLRLDMNNETNWYVASFSAPAPQLRRSMSSNAMTDGVNVSSSSYDSRVLTLVLESISTTQDLSATELQKLARELNRPNNILKYQPTGATKPVFFRTYRSDMATIEDVLGSKAFRRYTINLLAEPFALGLDETFSSTFTYDGSGAGSFEYTCPTILGDVTAPLVLDVTQTGIGKTSSFWLSSQAFPTAYTAPTLKRLATNAGLPLGTDTTGVTGAGSSFWNGDYVSTSFATPTMVSRIVRSSPGLTSAGTYRVLARVVLSAAATCQLRAVREVQVSAIPTYYDAQVGASAEITNTNPGFVDLGLFRVPFGTNNAGPSSGLTMPSTLWSIQAARTTGAGALRTDGLLFLPQIMDDAVSNTTAVVTGGGASLLLPNTTVRLDADRGQATILNSSTLAEVQAGVPTWSGTLPTVSPGCTNTLWWIPAGTAVNDPWPAVASTAFTGTYKPRYLFVRPATS